MRDCVILINDRLVSLSHTTHSSSLNTQLLLSLVHASVSESSFSPTDLTSLVLNVALECVCVLSWMGVTGDEVIGYNRDSIVIEDDILPRGHVWEVGVSECRGAVTCHENLYVLTSGSVFLNIRTNRCVFQHHQKQISNHIFSSYQRVCPLKLDDTEVCSKLLLHLLTHVMCKDAEVIYCTRLSSITWCLLPTNQVFFFLLLLLVAHTRPTRASAHDCCCCKQKQKRPGVAVGQDVFLCIRGSGCFGRNV